MQLHAAPATWIDSRSRLQVDISLLERQPCACARENAAPGSQPQKVTLEAVANVCTERRLSAADCVHICCAAHVSAESNRRPCHGMYNQAVIQHAASQYAAQVELYGTAFLTISHRPKPQHNTWGGRTRPLSLSALRCISFACTPTSATWQILL